MPIDHRRQTGQIGEQLAAEHLIRRGLQIVERNYRTRRGEIDLIAIDRSTVVFCEVKTRCRYGPGYSPTPLINITPSKQHQVRKIAREWLSEKTNREYIHELRFDAIGVTLERSGQLIAIEHLEGAF